jgi:hypothetical protein
MDYYSLMVVFLGFTHRLLTPPFPIRAAKAGRNHFERVKYPPPPQRDGGAI